MGRNIAFTFTGLAFTGLGIVLFYLFLISLNENGNLTYLIGFLLAFGAGIYLFIQVTKDSPSKNTTITAAVSQEASEKAFATKTNLIKEYERIDNQRNKMKMLEAAGSLASESEGK
jgi:hypothetical protein